MKYIKTIILFFSSLIILNLITTILYYFDITSTSSNNIFKIIIFIFTFLLSGIYIGRNSNKKGWLEGLKISGILIIFFLISSLIVRYNFNIKQVFYYLLSTIIIMFGSMIGINFKKRK